MFDREAVCTGGYGVTKPLLLCRTPWVQVHQTLQVGPHRQTSPLHTLFIQGSDVGGRSDLDFAAGNPGQMPPRALSTFFTFGVSVN